MKRVSSSTSACLALAVGISLVTTAHAVAYEVASCEDIAAVDDTVVSQLTVITDTIDCADYMRFRVRNTMTLSATVPEVTFSNFALKVLGELTVEPDVAFTGVFEQEKNGGVLHVSDAATATFMGAAHFYDNSNMETELPPIVYDDGGFSPQYIKRKGACIHNKGYLVFDGDATFERNTADTRDSTNKAKGGAISNTADGTIVFKSKLTMTENEAKGFFEGEGGGIYNRGDIVVEGESSFSENNASNGGAIYQEPWGSLVFNGMATFFDNTAYDSRGGAIANYGGDITFNAGSEFLDNTADGSGDGGSGAAIFDENGGTLIFIGPTSFKGGFAYFGGGAIYTIVVDTSSLTLPADAVFEDNGSDEEYCPDVQYVYEDGTRVCGP